MNRFFLPPSSFVNDEIVFPEAISRQIASVLRLKPDAQVTVLDGKGMEFSVQLLEVSPKQTSGKILSSQPISTEPQTQIRLLLCLTQREKFEWMLQKCTELGASSFVPVISSRSLVQSVQEAQSKFERWQKILSEAAEQSHRGIVPTLEPPLKFAQLLAAPPAADVCRLIPWEDEQGTTLRQALNSHAANKVEILIGPEGGFSVEEVKLATQAGFIAVTLGARILRMETAAMAATALVLYQRGDTDIVSGQAAQ